MQWPFGIKLCNTSKFRIRAKEIEPRRPVFWVSDIQSLVPQLHRHLKWLARLTRSVRIAWLVDGPARYLSATAHSRDVLVSIRSDPNSLLSDF